MCLAEEASDNECFQPRAKDCGRGPTRAFGTEFQGNSTWSRGREGFLRMVDGRKAVREESFSFTLTQETRLKRQMCV